MFLGFIGDCWIFFFPISSFFGPDSSVKQFFHKFLCMMKCFNRSVELWEALLYL
jgi:hypothetical protein